MPPARCAALMPGCGHQTQCEKPSGYLVHLLYTRRRPDPYASLNDVLARLATHPACDIGLVLSHRFNVTDADFRGMPRQHVLAGRLPTDGTTASQAALVSSTEVQLRLEGWKRTETIAETAARSHRRSQLLAAGSLLSDAPANALLKDIGQYLPDSSRDIRTTRLEPGVVNAELAVGLLEASGASLCVPAFYQPYIVNTLKKERTGMKKARHRSGHDDVLLTELVERLKRLASEIVEKK